MPIYLYQSKKTEEIREVFQNMNEKHEYFCDGEEWKRIWTIPQGIVSTKLDPFNSNQFVERTGKQKGTVGDVLDQSKELANKRKEILGHDPVQNKYFDQWSQKRAGRSHPADTRPKPKTKLKTKNDRRPNK